MRRRNRTIQRDGVAAALILAAWVCALPNLAGAQELRFPGNQPVLDAAKPVIEPDGEKLIHLDFDNVEIVVVIDTIAKMMNKNFIYDDRVRGRVTIRSPVPISLDQAYKVFESVLQVKGFTTVVTPGGAIKVIPTRDAKQEPVETVRSYSAPANADRFVTRLIPLRYIDAESIVNTLKPLISKDAAMAAYVPTNTVILTESASNIRRLLAIIESIDIETYKNELAVIAVEYADATTMAQQIAEIYGAEVSAAARTRSSRRSSGRQSSQTVPVAGGTGRDVRIITDERTNSLIVLASRTQINDVRDLVRRLDIPVSGGGRVHVYYLQHADAEELTQTLSALIGGQPVAGGGGAAGGAQAEALRSAVSALTGGISITADPATNALVIQASQEGFATLAAVIGKLDIERPQVLVEALIMEVQVSTGEDLGFNGLYRLVNGATDITVAQLTDAATTAAIFPPAGGAQMGSSFLANFLRDTTEGGTQDGQVIQGIIRATATNEDVNIISAPHILTMDNEEAEIRIGDNIPIITSRVESAQGVTTTPQGSLASSVNVERQDVGVTLRVTPQITEGNTLRLEIFQEITDVIASKAGDPNQVGVTLLNRRIENTVVVNDNETVVIGGLISDDWEDSVTKVPWLGNIPILGWLFKTTATTLRKVNLLVFLTPHIVRSRDEMERETIRKREEFRIRSGNTMALTDQQREAESERRARAMAAGVPYVPRAERNPAQAKMLQLEARNPLERMTEIERRLREEAERRAAAAVGLPTPEYFIQAPVLGDEGEAARTLTEILDAGYDGTLLSREAGGVLHFEIRVGPFDTLDAAQQAGVVIRRAHGLLPAVMVEMPEAP